MTIYWNKARKKHAQLSWSANKVNRISFPLQQKDYTQIGTHFQTDWLIRFFPCIYIVIDEKCPAGEKEKESQGIARSRVNRIMKEKKIEKRGEAKNKKK